MSVSSWIGKSVGDRYQIEEIIGSGGMSTVFKASDPNLKRVVAVKMIHPHMSMDEDFVRRFEEEAKGVAQLRHPHIVQVYDFNHDEDAYYMVLEFVPGESLAEHLSRLEKRGRQMSNQEVVKYGSQICQAVDYAHQRGLIHRDLKPANVMLDVYGDAILMDFGIAKIIGGTRHTATGAVIGTAMYMSPEQIKGMEIDHRTDIYSLGVMLFEMVSGKPPFQADSAMTLMMMHVNDPVPDLSQLRPDVPRGLVEVIEKALSKDRNDRYQSAAEMASALETALLQKLPSEQRDPLPPRNVLNQEHLATVKLDSEREAATNEGTLILDQEDGPVIVSAALPKTEAAYQGVPFEDFQKSRPKRKVNTGLLIGGGVGLLLVLLLFIAGFIFLPRIFDGEDEATPTIAVGQVDASVSLDGGTGLGGTGEDANPDSVLGVNLESTATATWTPTMEPSATPDPTATLEPTITPSPTFPTNYYVQITGISADSMYYIVDYETFGFTEQLPGTHIHFFFNTVPPEQAGVPGSGPWILYGGPRPFSQYRLSDKPADATMMCARVANPDHSLYDLASGNCYPLP